MDFILFSKISATRIDITTKMHSPDNDKIGTNMKFATPPTCRKFSLASMDASFLPPVHSHVSSSRAFLGRKIEMSALKIAKSENLDIEDAMVVAWRRAQESQHGQPEVLHRTQYFRQRMLRQQPLPHSSLLTHKRYMFFTLMWSPCSPNAWPRGLGQTSEDDDKNV